MIKSIQLKDSGLILDLSRGGKILSLFLSSDNHKYGREVIRGLPGNFFLSGSYFLFPWVNRIATTKFSYQGKDYEYSGKLQDEHGSPIHGIVFDTERKITTEENSGDSHIIRIVPEFQTPQFPFIEECFILRRNSLSITVLFSNRSHHTQFFSFGYHPYINLGTRVDSLLLNSNLNDLIPLNERLLPKPYVIPGGRKYIFQNGESIGNGELDHCITGTPVSGNPEVVLSRIDTGESVCISTDSDRKMFPLRYFQLYIPPDRNSIAIEPMSSAGDVFHSPVSGPQILFPGESRSGRFTIEYKQT